MLKADVAYSDQSIKLENEEEHFWNFGISDIVNALIAANLRIEFLHEFPYAGHNRFPGFLEQREDGRWWWKDPENTIPLVFSLKATKQ